MRNKYAKAITRTVWMLSIVSLFTDIASEMLYPVLPLYLKSIGFSVILIGVLEGFAEATAGLSKGYFGNLSDLRGKRLPFIRLGYFLSAVSKPMMALFTWPYWVFSVRTMDRLGKGIRTGARDAMLSDEATSATKGSVFGFHRAMDTLGAAVGPILALIFLHFYPASYRALFFMALAPGLLAVISTLVISEKRMAVPDRTKKIHFFSFLKYIPESSRNYRLLLSGLLLFALFNSSDLFLLLMLKQNGFNDTAMIGAYIFYNLVYVLFAFPLGMLADKYGLKKIFIMGLMFFAITYFGMAVMHQPLMLYGLFLLYGVYAASTEGVAKAWITNLASREDTATAIGTYEGLRSVTALMSSALAGFIWFYIRPEAIFFMTGTAVVLIILFFIRIPASTHLKN